MPTSPTPLADTFHRREFLAASAAAALGLATVPLSVASARVQRRSAGEPVDAKATKALKPARIAKNVIFMVSDGMSFGTLSLAQLWTRQHEQRDSQWVSLWSRPDVRRSVQQTACADSLVTDSAAAGSAWGSGLHIDTGSINVTREGKQLLPIMVQAQQMGKRTGVVTTARVTHATPASFITNSPRRDYEGLIARQMLERGLDVALGGGDRFFPQSQISRFPEVVFVRDKAELAAAPLDKRLFGLFHDQHVPFVLDRAQTVPGLVDMTTKALAMLDRPAGGNGSTTGFVLQIEAGRVDHAAHSNDAGALISEQVEFDRTIATVLEFVRDRDDTLVIITTDHGNANPGLTLYREAGIEGFARIAGVKHSFEWIDDQLSDVRGAKARAALLPKLVTQATGIELSPEDTRILSASLLDERVSPFASANKWPNVLGAILADHLGIGFVSPNHTADLTEVTAFGPGSELIPPYIDNIDLHAVMVAGLGLEAGKLLEGMEEPMVAPTRPKAD